MKKTIYIVDDEPKIGSLFGKVLRRTGYKTETFARPQTLFEELDAGARPDLILTDLMMPGMSGMDLLHALKERGLNLPVIIMTAHSSVQTAVEAMRLGAYHYLQKPVNLEEMRELVAKALDLYDTEEDGEEVAEKKPRRRRKVPATDSYPIEGILGESSAIESVRRTIRMLVDVPNTIVLLRGETGTGKNHVAKTIHFNSAYNAGRFIEINCAALPDNLLEAELFGYERGAFTDARDEKEGLLEVADGGTLFLDEVDSMSPGLQAKLLSFLESRTFRRLGGTEEKRVTTRILCATNADLESLVAEKKFRKDLFFRINVVSLHLPPLRGMGRDIVTLARNIVKQFDQEMGKEISGLAPGAEERLLEHTWPGNVRELRNVLERAAIFSQTPTIDRSDILVQSSDAIDGEVGGSGAFRFPTGRTLEDLEREYIFHTLKDTDQTYADVADQLGISKKTLWEKRKRYNLDEAVGR